MCENKNLFDADDIKILVMNKMNKLLKNIDNTSKGEIVNHLHSLKNLVLMY